MGSEMCIRDSGRLVDVDQEIDFIGKEALKKIKQNGTKEKLVGLEL